MVQGTPRGFRDILPTEALARERIRDTVRACFQDAGYLPVETPLLERRDVLEGAGRLQDSPFQLFDTDRSLLVLRPDLTLPVARLVATRYGAGDLPLRLRYSAPVVREQSSLKGQPREFTQLGVERFGGKDDVPEVEMVGLLARVFDQLEVPDWRIVCGSVSPLMALLDACSPARSFTSEVLRLAHESDLVGLDALVGEAEDAGAISPAAAAALRGLSRLAGGAETVDELDRMLAAAGVTPEEANTGELRALIAGLPELVDSGRLTFDFSIINSFDYYTGIVFKGYAEGIAASIASGGRYDSVLANLGRDDVSACGFMCSLERLQEILGERGASGVVTPGVRLAERPLRIAVPKGSLFADTVRILEAAGLPVENLRNPERKLLVREKDVEYVIVRAQDAPAFVAHGGADCGICGNDSIIEANVDLLQLVDLEYGACRFVVAEPRAQAGAADAAYGWRGSVRVATKYPRITQHYYDSIGRQVDIIQLHGNIELGPLVGMCDRIVDITATGTTLAENDLVVVDEVLRCAARFFAGPAAYRCDPRIRKLARRLAANVPSKEQL